MSENALLNSHLIQVSENNSILKPSVESRLKSIVSASLGSSYMDDILQDTAETWDCP